MYLFSVLQLHQFHYYFYETTSPNFIYLLEVDQSFYSSSLILKLIIISENMIKYVIIYLCIALMLAIPYNQSTSKTNIYFSVITHCSKNQIETWSCALCKQYPHLTDVKQIDNSLTSILGFVGYDKLKNDVVVAWRGTTDYKNWIADGDFKLTTYSGCSNCQIHQGFYLAYLSIAAKLQDAITALFNKYPTANLVITGHSLGGSIATITALQLSKKYSAKIKELYVFGCPRVGNGQLASFIKGKFTSLYRVIHNQDLVPHLPPSAFQYLHAPYEVLYDQKMATYVVCDASGEDKTCSDRFSPNYLTSDHDVYWVKTDSSIC